VEVITEHSMPYTEFILNCNSLFYSLFLYWKWLYLVASYSCRMSDWAAGLGLLLLNSCSTSTCMAWGRYFVVDIIWCTPNAFRRVSSWRVAVGGDSLSLPVYIHGYRAGDNAREKGPCHQVMENSLTPPR
jgi:hypothetical protein